MDIKLRPMSEPIPDESIIYLLCEGKKGKYIVRGTYYTNMWSEGKVEPSFRSYDDSPFMFRDNRNTSQLKLAIGWFKQEDIC